MCGIVISNIISFSMHCCQFKLPGGFVPVKWKLQYLPWNFARNRNAAPLTGAGVTNLFETESYFFCTD